MLTRKLERLILRLRGELTIAGESTIKALVNRDLKIGENCHILPGVTIDSSHCWLVEIGNNVTIAPDADILAHDASTKKSLGYTRIGKVIVGDNVFIGARAIVLPNVAIGSHVIVGAGSVVNQNIPDNMVAVGNPVRIVSTLDTYLEKHREQMRQLPFFDDSYTWSKGVTPEMRTEMIEKMADGQGYIV